MLAEVLPSEGDLYIASSSYLPFGFFISAEFCEKEDRQLNVVREGEDASSSKPQSFAPKNTSVCEGDRNKKNEGLVCNIGVIMANKGAAETAASAAAASMQPKQCSTARQFLVQDTKANSLAAKSSAIASLAVAALTAVTQDVLSFSAYLIQFVMATGVTAILALTMCGAPSRAMLVVLSRFAKSRAGLIAQFAFAITMAKSLSKRMICRSNLMNGEDRRSNWKASMCKIECQNTCGGEQSLQSKGIFFSDKICQYLGDNRSFIEIGSLRNFQELLQVLTVIFGNASLSIVSEGV